MQELVLKPNGQILRREVSEYYLKVDDAAFESLAKKTPITIRNVAKNDAGPIHCQYSPQHDKWYWTVPINQLMLKSNYIKLEDGTLVMDFSSRDLILPITWTPPATMQLRILIESFINPEVPSQTVCLNRMYLLCFDENKRFWKTPLPNVYNDCRICHGRDAVPRFETHQECIGWCVDKFNRSEWNADLLERPEMLRAMFRFRAEGKSFVQQPVPDNWQSLCQKVAVELFNLAII